MSIKSTKPEALVSSSDYPKLMISDIGNIVLFTEAKVGTLLHSGNGNYSIGDHIKDWCMNDFADYANEITLSNES